MTDLTRRSFSLDLLGLLGSCSLNSLDLSNKNNFEKYQLFMQNEGGKLAKLYRESSLYPSRCTDISQIVPELAKKYGIDIQTVEGFHNSLTPDIKGGYHAFNVIRLDEKEYILDFTRDQFTRPTKPIILSEGFSS